MPKHAAETAEHSPAQHLAREMHFSTRHLPVAYHDALHILMQKMEPQRLLWQVVNMALRRGIKALAEEKGIENPLVPKGKNGKVAARQETEVRQNDE